MVINEVDIIKELLDLVEMMKQGKVLVESIDISSNPIYASTMIGTNILVKTELDIRLRGVVHA